MNRQQRRAAGRGSPDLGPTLNGDQGEALTNLVTEFLIANTGHAQPFALLVTNGQGLNVLGNAGPELLSAMLEVAHTQPKINISPGALSGDVGGSA